MSAESIVLRKAHPQEIGAIALLIARANAQRDGNFLPTTVMNDQLLDLQGRMDKPNVWACVAVEGEEVTGFALGYPRTDDRSAASYTDTEYLSLLMVEPNSWGKGIASKLIDIVAEQSRNAGRNRLTLRTRDMDNDHARRVYEHKGFALTGFTKESHYGRQVEYQLDL